MKYILAVATEL